MVKEEEEEKNEEKYNEGFDKLPGEENRVGLFVLKIRQFLFSMIQKQKTIVGYAVKALFLIGFIIYFGFAMSTRYGTPAFPIRGNVFYGNAGRNPSIRKDCFRWVLSRFCVVFIDCLCGIYFRMGKISGSIIGTFIQTIVEI